MSRIIRAGSMEADPVVAQALLDIQETWDTRVSVSKKAKNLQKFGRNVAMSQNTQVTIWDTGVAHETFLGNGVNTITQLSGSVLGDAGRSIGIEGHTSDGSGNKTFVVQFVSLDGSDARDPVAIPTGLNRCTRLFNADGTDLTGAVYASTTGAALTNGVPDDLNTAKCVIRAGQQQSNKCASSLSSVDWFIITQVYVGVARQQQAIIDFELQIRELGGVFRERMPFVANRDSGGVPIDLRPAIVVPADADFRMVGTSNANSTTGFAWLNGVLAITEGS